jgi:hypothetical protein
MADGYLTVAQTAGGVSCLFLPRRLPDGSLNNIKINRLKDKLGNKANASSEIEYHDAHAVLVGEEGKGIRTILSAAEYTRLDFSVGSAGLMRAALSQALHYNDYRTAFGAPLARLPMQAPVLADLVLEWAGATHLRWAQGGIVQASVEGFQVLTPAAESPHCGRQVPGLGGALHRFHGLRPDFERLGTPLPAAKDGWVTTPQAPLHAADRIFAPPKGLSALGSDPASFPACHRHRRSRQPATGPPSSYPDRTSTGRRRRAYEHVETPCTTSRCHLPFCWAHENLSDLAS